MISKGVPSGPGPGSYLIYPQVPKKPMNKPAAIVAVAMMVVASLTVLCDHGGTVAMPSLLLAFVCLFMFVSIPIGFKASKLIGGLLVGWLVVCTVIVIIATSKAPFH